MNEQMSINNVLAETGLSNNYVRKAIAAGKLKVTKGVVPGTKIPKNYIDRSDFEAWRAGVRSSMRSDGRNKFVMYMRADELDAVRELLATMPDVLETLARANQKSETEVEDESE
jgi:hypothetical protein